MSERPTPSPALRKHGITAVRDDLPAGASLRCATAFGRYFEREIEAAIAQRFEENAAGDSEKSEAT